MWFQKHLCLEEDGVRPALPVMSTRSLNTTAQSWKGLQLRWAILGRLQRCTDSIEPYIWLVLHCSQRCHRYIHTPHKSWLALIRRRESKRGEWLTPRCRDISRKTRLRGAKALRNLKYDIISFLLPTLTPCLYSCLTWKNLSCLPLLKTVLYSTTKRPTATKAPFRLIPLNCEYSSP